MRPHLIALGILVLLGSVPPAAQADGLAATCNGASITVSYAGYNFGDLPLVVIWRRNLTDCGSWAPVTASYADPLAWTEIEAVDTEVVPDKLYRYSVGPPSQPEAFGENPIDYQGISWHVTAFVGCGNVPVAEGTLQQDWVGAQFLTWTVPCPGSCYPSAVLGSGLDVVGDYLDGEPVTLLGSYFWTLHTSWGVLVTSAEPGDCTTVDVEARPWSALKRMYR